MNPIHTSMRSLLRHEGVWEGRYQLVGSSGQVVDEHQSRIEVRFPEEGQVHYLQRNYFWWEDGREFRGEYPGVCREGVLYWDNDLIRGRAWSVDEYSTVLTWQRYDSPGVYLYEIILINEQNDLRSRTWHWFRDGLLYQRTLIDERKVAP